MTKHRNQSTYPSFINLFDEVFNQVGNAMTLTTPAVNISKTDKAYKIELSVPAMEKEDITIAIDKNELIISGEKKKADAREKYIRREFNYGSFKRSFTLSDDIDIENISATHKNGVLTVELALYTAEQKAEQVKKITIS